MDNLKSSFELKHIISRAITLLAPAKIERPLSVVSLIQTGDLRVQPIVAISEKPIRNAARAYVCMLVKQYYGRDCRGASNPSSEVWVKSIANHMLPKRC